ncbi:unnamed protein product, partial [Rotaria magnacalcarata]
MFNNYSETSSSTDMLMTNEEWKNKYLNEVMNDNLYEYKALNINPRDDLLYNRYNIRKKLAI